MNCKLCGCKIGKKDAVSTIGKTKVHWMCKQRMIARQVDSEYERSETWGLDAYA